MTKRYHVNIQTTRHEIIEALSLYIRYILIQDMYPLFLPIHSLYLDAGPEYNDIYKANC
jgi:hypothetical protein